MQSIYYSLKVYDLIKNAFCEEIEDKSFRFWLCKKLCIDSNKFITSLSLWKENDFQEVRGRKSLSIDLKQMIYNEWIENSIPSVDCRNGRVSMKIRKINYTKQFSGIVNSPDLDEETNRRGIKMYTAPRRIITCTVSPDSKEIDGNTWN